MGLSTEQRRNVRRVIQRAKRKGASPRELKAAVTAAAVESNYRHLSYGDRDSVGILQQRPSQGWGPAGESIERDVDQFLAQARKVNRAGFKGSAGQLAQAVQRSAFPGRYDERGSEADRLIRQFGGKVSPSGGGSPQKSSGGRVVARTTTTPGVDNSALRQSLKLDYLQNRGKPGALISLATGLQEAKDTPATKKTSYDIQGGEKQSQQPASSSSSGNRLVETAKQRAEKINNAKVPYKWGGGHGGKVSLKDGVIPMDCSGAVSAVLGINPRVSGQFTKFGSPGRAPGGKGITLYANSGHILMEIDGRFWGTSKSNPGGGAGWIPRSQISSGYLSKFTARHLKRSVQ